MLERREEHRGFLGVPDTTEPASVVAPGDFLDGAVRLGHDLGVAGFETAATEQGAHTIGWDPDGRRLYVFCPERGGALVLEERG